MHSCFIVVFIGPSSLCFQAGVELTLYFRLTDFKPVIMPLPLLKSWDYKRELPHIGLDRVSR